jgi:hypothetical protein
LKQEITLQAQGLKPGAFNRRVNWIQLVHSPAAILENNVYRRLARLGQSRDVALQVAFERQTLKPFFHLIGYRLWLWKVIGYGSWVNLIQSAEPHRDGVDQHLHLAAALGVADVRAQDEVRALATGQQGRHGAPGRCQIGYRLTSIDWRFDCKITWHVVSNRRRRVRSSLLTIS